jgi:KR domain
MFICSDALACCPQTDACMLVVLYLLVIHLKQQDPKVRAPEQYQVEWWTTLICSGKVAGAEALVARTKAAPLVALNLFSSLAAFSGSGGQGVYAAANGALDSHAVALQVHCKARTNCMPCCSRNMHPAEEQRVRLLQAERCLASTVQT